MGNYLLQKIGLGVGTLILALAILIASGAARASPGGCFGSAGADTCQFEVTSNSSAPAQTISSGIRLDGGIQNILFNNFSGNSPSLCRFIDNAGSNIFVPQNTAAEFVSFLDSPPSGIGFAQCVMPASYSATPSLSYGTYAIDQEGGPPFDTSGVASPPTQSVAVPQANLWAGCGASPALPCNIARAATTPLQSIDTINSGGGPIAFLYTRYDCPPGATDFSQCSRRQVKEEQTITFSADPSPNSSDGNGVWDKQSVASTWFISDDGVNWTSISGPFADYESCAHSTQSWGSPGTYTFTIPASCGPSAVYTITLIGAGGAGSYGYQGCCGGASGGGGGGGAYLKATASGFYPSNVLTVTIASGPPTASSVSGPNLWLAAGSGWPGMGNCDGFLGGQASGPGIRSGNCGGHGSGAGGTVSYSGGNIGTILAAGNGAAGALNYSSYVMNGGTGGNNGAGQGAGTGAPGVNASGGSAWTYGGGGGGGGWPGGGWNDGYCHSNGCGTGGGAGGGGYVSISW